MPDARSSTAMVIAISAVAYALADMVHEALGHGLLSLLVPGVMRLLYAAMASQVRRSSLDGRDIRRVIIVSYVAGSALILFGAAFNPIKQLIWLSGLAVGFAGTFGFVPVGGWIEHIGAGGTTRPAVRFSAMWIIFGAIIAAVFVLILGPGLRLSGF